MLAECIPFFLAWITPPLVAFGIGTCIAEVPRIRVLGIFLYAAVFVVLAPSMMVMGSWGPAHVAADAGIHAWPLLLGVLAIKTAILYARDWLGKSAPRVST